MDTSEFDIEFLALKLSENPQSPLFARLADLYLGKEQTVEALKLCEEGIPLYPNYYAGHLVEGKIHLALKEYSKARTALEKARKLSPFNQIIPALLSSIPKQPDESTRTTDENYFVTPEEQTPAEISAEAEVSPLTIKAQNETLPAEESVVAQPEFEESPPPRMPEKTYMTFDEYNSQHSDEMSARPVMTLDEYLSSSLSSQPAQEQPATEEKTFTPLASTEMESAAQSAPPASAQTAEPEPVFASPEQAQLFAEMMGEASPPPASPSIDELATKLQNAERIVPAENYQPQHPTPISTEEQATPGMVTPTLAEIYASQGEYNAAIQAYEILQFSQPDKAGEYQKRIRELQQQQMEKEGLI